MVYMMCRYARIIETGDIHGHVQLGKTRDLHELLVARLAPFSPETFRESDAFISPQTHMERPQLTSFLELITGLRNTRASLKIYFRNLTDSSWDTLVFI